MLSDTLVHIIQLYSFTCNALLESFDHIHNIHQRECLAVKIHEIFLIIHALYAMFFHFMRRERCSGKGEPGRGGDFRHRR